jgi:putative glycerol-1-phosphate prenyltransferase
MMGKVYDSIKESKTQKKKSFAVLVDPDKTSLSKADDLIDRCTSAGVDLIFVGGSLVVSNHLEDLVQHIKKECDIPVLLFPGSPSQVTPYADALLYLSLISGRNPELLIGQHVISAPAVKKSGLEVIPTGYMLIDGGAPTTVSYISNTFPIPSDKHEIALCTAWAGELLGMKLIYMDAGSGALHSIPEAMVAAVAQRIEIPLIVGGGIRSGDKAYNICHAGADIIVVGNAIEKESSLIVEISDAVHAHNREFSLLRPTGN